MAVATTRDGPSSAATMVRHGPPPHADKHPAPTQAGSSLFVRNSVRCNCFTYLRRRTACCAKFLTLCVRAGCDLHALLVAANALLAAFNPAAPCLVTPFDLRDFLAGRLGKFRLVHTTKATGSFYRHQHLLQADTTHSKRKRQGDGLIAPPCAPVAFRLADISTGSPGACSGTLPLWQQLQQALALEENETCDFNKIASFAV